jgi:ribosomal protein S6
MITDHKGEVTYAEEWGKKKLAYPIAHNSHGYYYLIEFDVLGEQMQKMDRWLKMNRDILRYQIVKTKKRTQEEKEQENEKRAQAKHKKEVDEEKREQELKQEKEEKKEKKDRGKDDKTDLKDLDKKLDDILDSHDLL